ncbi:MAG: hypothetical protein P8P65_10925 [Planktotalea sp.]|uniref:hypothetical protein n=1 Tax=Planktotalea sp. TaxID=2029877 RepID=UPI0001838AF4|nr:hypothetical protein [Planktotalea sp.]EDZ41070.1 conserved hypothetical protein [Rhodobacteraceae bacterium HTCC2083]MDG1077137.1 hypothetical protein [Planktotalea sp.]MDG1085826.1 hypothetical protein [Planktotalea sp.]HCW84153.1 hypothetical protein [Paracoccaceae bacterium]
MSKLLDLENPFFAPLWIRIAVVAVMTLWGLFELSQAAYMWSIIFLGFAAICGWRFATIDYSARDD